MKKLIGVIACLTTKRQFDYHVTGDKEWSAENILEKIRSFSKPDLLYSICVYEKEKHPLEEPEVEIFDTTKIKTWEAAEFIQASDRQVRHGIEKEDVCIDLINHSSLVIPLT